MENKSLVVRFVLCRNDFSFYSEESSPFPSNTFSTPPPPLGATGRHIGNKEKRLAGYSLGVGVLRTGKTARLFSPPLPLQDALTKLYWVKNSAESAISSPWWCPRPGCRPPRSPHCTESKVQGIEELGIAHRISGHAGRK